MIRDDEKNRISKLGRGIKYFSLASSLIIKQTGPLSMVINSMLRRPKKNHGEFIKLYEHLLNRLLDKLYGYSSQIVYRMDDPNIEYEILKVWFQKRIGEVISFPWFLATSKTRWKNRDTVYRIKTSFISNGKDVSNLKGKSNSLNEEEVLFKSRSKFKIIGVNEKDNCIDLEEVDRRYSEVIVMDENVYCKDEEIVELLGLEDNDNQMLSASDLRRF